MKRRFLITTVVSMSLLSLNLFAGSQCTGGFCMVDLSKNSPSIKKEETIKEVKKDINEYEMASTNDVETIVLPHSEYIMTDLEVAEYDLEQMQDFLVTPILDSENLPTSDYFCEDDLKPVVVVGMEDTYECT